MCCQQRGNSTVLQASGDQEQGEGAVQGGRPYKKLTATLAELKEESRLKEEVKKAKTNLAMELAILHKLMDKAKADIVVEFRVS